MVKSLFTGVTGLKAHQQRMDMIGNNIANVNTTGYKTDVMTFADVYYQSKRTPSAPTGTLGGINPRQVGYGVKVSSVEANLAQSGYNYTDSKTDIALDGKGFFQVMDGAGNIFYTRAGNFKFDSAGYLVNADGYHVLGVSGTADGVEGSSDIIRAIIPNTGNNVSSQTKKINGTNVTITVSAPSEYTDMSVAFQQADFPYATYNNNLLTIFFDKEAQYDSKDAFDSEIRKALTAGGVNLPDDVEISMDFDPIPSQVESVTAKNTYDQVRFSTENATARFHIYKEGRTGTDHAYIDFSTNDNTRNDNIKLIRGTVNGSSKTGEVQVMFSPNGAATDLINDGTTNIAAAKGWNIVVYEDTTAADINKAINDYLAKDANSGYPKLTCTGMQIPSNIKRADAIAAFTGSTPTDTTIKVEGGTAPAAANANKELFGVPSDSSITGKFDFGATVPGEYANKYKIQFAKKSGYDCTSVSWEDNVLTINVCANTTISDINKAIKEASGGDEKKVLRFYDITGLDYGKPIVSRDAEGRIVTEFGLGYTAKYDGTATKWYDKNGLEVETNAEKEQMAKDLLGATGTFATLSGMASTNGTLPATYPEKVTGGVTGDETVWNVETRNKFFGGNPAMNPADGDDSFYTKTAKALSTFNLTNGRIGSEQTMDEFTDYMIQSDGLIVGLHPVYGTMVLGRVDIATFDNPNGLEKVGGTNFRATVASGAASVKRPGEDGAGAIVPNALEMSNVDLADEFTNMIATQRGYQANSRVVTVSDTMIEELLSLKR